MNYKRMNMKIQYLIKSHPPKNKYLGINLTKEMKDLNNNKTLIKEIKEDSEMEGHSMLLGWKN